MELWDPSIPFPETLSDIPPVPYAEYSLPHRSSDEIRFLHQSGIGFHNDTLFVGWVNGARDEAAQDLVINGRRSRDRGRTWSPLETIAPEIEGKERWDYCSFFSHDGDMWAITTRTHDAWDFREPKMEGFIFNETTGEWEPQGVLVEDFVASDKIRRLDNGNFIMAGMYVHDQRTNNMENRIAISDGEDLTSWRLTGIPHETGLRWPLISLIVEGSSITAILRNSRDTMALVSFSEDYGETWSEARPSNLPMVAVKPFAGVLSTGQRYLIACTPAEPGDHSRRALTIVLSEPGEKKFSRIWRISRGEPHPLRFEGAAKSPQWSYPKAVERNGELYVIYSVNKEDAETAVIPIESLNE